MRRPADAYWYDLKDKARIRGRGKCEYCRLRQVAALHHRHYRTEGAEKLKDVMAVCNVCHQAIHGLLGGREITVMPGSLAHQGDTGFDRFVTGKLWKRYLASRARSAAAAGRPKRAIRRR
jgi:hypothetical protein